MNRLQTGRMGIFICQLVLAVVIHYHMKCVRTSCAAFLAGYDVQPLANDTFRETSIETKHSGFAECIYPSDCKVVRKCYQTKSGVYRVYPFAVGKGFLVYCDMVTNGGGWLVFQRRQDGSVDFYRRWKDYKDGFGNLYGEFWLGLEKLHLLTSQREYELLINLLNFTGKSLYSAYSRFHISAEKEKFRLMLGSYTGTAQDVMTYHNGCRFSTLDSDNDLSERECAVRHHGAWWYKDCLNINLNGEYVHTEGSSNFYKFGMTGSYWQRKYGHLQFVEMKIRPVGNL